MGLSATIASMLRAVTLALTCLSCCEGAAAAESGARTLEPHTRIRISFGTPDSSRVLNGPPLSASQLHARQFVGTLQGRRDDDVVIRVRPPGTDLAIPARSVTRLEESLGKHGRARRGAAIGLGVGLVGGVVTGVIVCSSGDCESSGYPSGGPALVSTFLGTFGAIAGAGIGALTGSQIRSERWRVIPIQDVPYGEGLSPEDGLRLGLNLPIWRRTRSFAGTEGQ